MGKLKKGFSLIELLVVLAIIAILAIIIAPKMRQVLAKAKDSRAIALLGSVRSIGESLIFEKTINSSEIKISFQEVFNKVDNKGNELVDKDGGIEIGGVRNKEDESKIIYGGRTYIFIGNKKEYLNPEAGMIEVRSESEIHLGTGVETDKSTEGKLWKSY